MRRNNLSQLMGISLVTAAALSCLLTGAASAASSKELIENARSLDGSSITYRGEAITQAMVRGGSGWINLNDGQNAIGAWCRTEDIKSIKYFGDYKNKGAIVEVRGIFNRACSEHNGELDIHAVSFSIIDDGYSVTEKLTKRYIYIAAGGMIFALLALAAVRKKI